MCTFGFADWEKITENLNHHKYIVLKFQIKKLINITETETQIIHKFVIFPILLVLGGFNKYGSVVIAQNEAKCIINVAIFSQHSVLLDL
jgi:hypothetical protein